MATTEEYIESIILTANNLYDFEETLGRPSFADRLREIDEDLTSLLGDVEDTEN
jgi:hypothetical protein